MTREELRAKAAARRSGEEAVPMTKAANWKCEFCQRAFVRESMFMMHSCPEKRRATELKSALGQTAYVFYSEWMKKQGHSVPSIETFATSKYFSQFYTFAEFAKLARLPSPLAFIALMAETKTQPALWRNPATHEIYMRLYDERVPPEDQFMQAFDTLSATAADRGVVVSQVFSVMTTEEILDLIERRRLTHWFLLSSQAFKSFYNSRQVMEKQALGHAMQIDAAVARRKLISKDRLNALAQAAAEGGL